MLTSCPECASPHLKNLRTSEAETGDEDYAVSTTKYLCQDCRCQFQVTERTEWTTEVTAHGREYVPEESEED